MSGLSPRYLSRAKAAALENMFTVDYQLTHIIMGYLHELRQELEEILGDALDEETGKAVLKFVGTKVYESWKNGVEHGKAETRLDTVENAFKKSGKRFSKKPHQSEPNGSPQ